MPQDMQDALVTANSQDSVQVKRLKRMLDQAVTEAQRKQITGLIRDQQRGENKAAKIEAQMEEQRRRTRVKNLRECGELVELAGLLDLDRGVLLGALHFIAGRIENDGNAVRTWALDGSRVLEAQAAGRKKENKPAAANDNAQEADTQNPLKLNLLRDRGESVRTTAAP